MNVAEVLDVLETHTLTPVERDKKGRVKYVCRAIECPESWIVKEGPWERVQREHQAAVIAGLVSVGDDEHA